MPNKHKIHLPKSMLNCITDENLDNFIEELSQSLKFYLKVVRVAKAVHPEHKDCKNTELVTSKSYTYIDDNKQDNYGIITNY